MTFNPSDLMDVREAVHEVTGDPLNALGIMGDPAHAASGGYHEGHDDLARVGRASSDYSVRESARDRNGLSNAASAFDLGGEWTAGRAAFLRFNALVMADCRNGVHGTEDIREVICTLDGHTVVRYDRLGIRSSGDSSHLSHTHFSFFRDSEGRRAGAYKTWLLNTIRLALAGETPAPPPAPSGGRPTIQRGAKGIWVRRIQGLLVAHGVNPGPVDGDFGPRTDAAVHEFQRQQGIDRDGIVGPVTWGRLVAATPEIRRGAKGDTVRRCQGLLVAAGWSLVVDGDFGPITDGAVRSFQGHQHIGVDGVVGPVTWGRLTG